MDGYVELDWGNERLGGGDRNSEGLHFHGRLESDRIHVAALCALDAVSKQIAAALLDPEHQVPVSYFIRITLSPSHDELVAGGRPD